MERLGRPVLLKVVTWATLVLACSAIFAESPSDEPPRYCTGLITAREGVAPIVHSNTVRNASVMVGCTENVRIALEKAGRECEHFTVMRHPIDRVVSSFYYCPTDHDIQNRPSKWCGDSEGETAPLQERFMEYAKARGNRVYLRMRPSLMCNLSVDLCDKVPGHVFEKGPLDLTTPEGREVHAGIKRILATFTAVGIFENWELTMRLFDATVKSPVRQWDASLAANPGSYSPARDALSDWAHTNADLHSLLSADLLLYEYASSLFRNQTRDILGEKWT